MARSEIHFGPLLFSGPNSTSPPAGLDWTSASRRRQYRVLNDPETRRGFTGGKLEQFDAPVEIVA
jgi:hypothetical protein